MTPIRTFAQGALQDAAATMTVAVIAAMAMTTTVAAADDGAAGTSIAAAAAPANSPERVAIYNYGCYDKAEMEFSSWQLEYLENMFLGTGDAEAERKILGHAIGRMYNFAGEKTPIWRDHGGNLNDDGVNGMMDCIDHTRNTSAFLALLKRNGLLRFHDVSPPLRRRMLVADHWTARVSDTSTRAEFAVDAWYFEPGEPASVMPIEDWMFGKDPRD